jgi:hypothetical protein
MRDLYVHEALSVIGSFFNRQNQDLFLLCYKEGQKDPDESDRNTFDISLEHLKVSSNFHQALEAILDENTSG